MADEPTTLTDDQIITSAQDEELSRRMVADVDEDDADDADDTDTDTDTDDTDV
jgi:hypothetical protein